MKLDNEEAIYAALMKINDAKTNQLLYDKVIWNIYSLVAHSELIFESLSFPKTIMMIIFLLVIDNR